MDDSFELVECVELSKLSEYVESSRDCRLGPVCTIGKLGRLMLNLNSFCPDEIRLTIRRKSGNGMLMVNSGSASNIFRVASKIGQDFKMFVRDSKKVDIRRPSGVQGDIEITSVVLVKHVKKSVEWDSLLSRATERQSIKLVGNRIVASEGSKIVANKIGAVETFPPNMYRKTDTEVCFLGACEIVYLDIDGEGKRAELPAHIEEGAKPLAKPVSESSSHTPKAVATPSQNKPPKKKEAPSTGEAKYLIFDSENAGFNRVLINGQGKVIMKQGLSLNPRASYRIPVDIHPNSYYVVVLEARSLSGNGKVTATVHPGYSNQTQLVPTHKKTLKFMCKSAPQVEEGGETFVTIERTGASTGELLIHRIMIMSSAPREKINDVIQQYGTSPVTKDEMAEVVDDWQLVKIPRIIHFYWGGKKLPYLRYVSIYSFIKHNPGWKVKVHTPAVLGTAKPTWGTNEQRQTVHTHNVSRDYMAALKELPLEVVKHDFSKYSFNNSAHEVHKSDFLRWILLASEGGIWSDCDIIFTQPMSLLTDNKKVNRNIDTGICKYKSGAHAIGFLMASSKNAFYQSLSQLARRSFKKNGYQSIGADILNKRFGTIKKSAKNSNILNINPDNVYAITQIPKFVSKNTFIQDYERSIGFHWYGGHPDVSKVEANINSENYKENQTFIGKLVQLTMDQ